MTNPNAVVDRISNLSPSAETFISREAQPPPQFVTVNFQGGRSGRLDMRLRSSALWAKRLAFRRQNNKPVYVEIDPETNFITELLIPEASRVRSLNTINGGDVEVTLAPSPALYYLRETDPDFGELQSALQTAMDNDSTVLVTWTHYKREIVDVRSFPEGQKDPLAPPETPPTPNGDPPVSPERARELFASMNARSCDPCTPTEPCIPFKYPTNGCHARAHEMCRLMLEEEETPEKIWLYRSSPSRSLRVFTSNDPDCEVSWWYHVAPTLNVEISPDVVEKWVVDPSMFNDIVPVEEWINAQNRPDAIDEYSDASVYFKDQGFPTGSVDNDYSDTAEVLEDRRSDLEKQCDDYGPSPYSCPITRNCTLITDRSTFGEEEVAAMLADVAPARFENAFYVIVDGFSPQELGITSVDTTEVAPTISIVPTVEGMTVPDDHDDHDGPDLTAEYPDYLERRQRLTWTYQVKFANTDAFIFPEEVPLLVTLTASIATVSDDAIIRLIRQASPYEIDGETHWLSTDLRVFHVLEGGTRFRETMGRTPDEASAFITNVIQKLNDPDGDTGGETFENIETDLQTWLYSAEVDGTRVFYFAVARVRYRSAASSADNVRVFFRLFPWATTSLQYNQTTAYPRGGSGDVTIPLVGIQDGELTTVPCFAEPRINTVAGTDMNLQSDTPNVQPEIAATGNENYTYFGCWLDVNQERELFFPTGRKSILEHIRGKHQCLVAEIAFDPDPIPDGLTPATSDKLAQRNLVIEESANPGEPSSRRIPHTFNIRPTPTTLEAVELPDELMIDWGNTPSGGVATIFMPGIDAAAVLDRANEMYGSHRLTQVDEHTLQCQADGITYMPIPSGIDANLAGLLSVDLPETVERGQAYTIVVHQVTNAQGVVLAHDPDSPPPEPIRWRRILGSFQLNIPVRAKEELLEPEARLLSVLRWIQRAIPDDDRWYAVFRRYVDQIAARVDALGGNSSEVVPSPSGDWKGVQARCRTLAIITAVLLAVLIVVLGILGNPITVAVIAIFLAAVVCTWLLQCRPKLCRLLRTFIAGAGSGALILAIALLLGATAPQLTTVLVSTITLVAIAGVFGIRRNCF